MTKAELVEKMAADAGISKAAAGAALDSLVGAVQKTLKKGEKFPLSGLGTFSVSKRKAREGRNPQTGEALKIPARKVPKFSASKTLKDIVK